MSSLNGGYHRKQTKAKQNEETIKMQIDLAIYFFTKILSRIKNLGDSLMKNILGGFVFGLFSNFAYKMKNLKRVEKNFQQ